jgi:hypothetical protein
MDRKTISIAVVIVTALFATHPARAQTVIEDWNQAKLPPPPLRRPLTVIGGPLPCVGS